MLDGTPRLPSVIVIGGGFCGAMCALHLLRDRADVAFRLDIVEPRPVLGAGLAYSSGDPEHRINVSAARMSPFIEDDQHLDRWLREDGVRAPVLMLTARDAIEDRVQGLDTGADDYLTKPFSFAELSARLRALARRGPIEQPTVLRAGDLHLDPASKRVWRETADISLSAREYALLHTFMRRPGQVLDRFELLEHAWDCEYENRSNVIDVYVRYLREKVDRPFGVRSIETVRGAGYRLRPDGGRGAGAEA